jgi:hypothetical protein
MLTFELDAADFEIYAAKYPDRFVEALTTRLDMLNTELATRTAASIGSLLNRRTGAAAASVMMYPAAVNGDVVEGGITAGGDAAPYLIFHEEGTRGPYEILPVRARALRFELEGRMVFRARVLHPGVIARAPVGSAFEQFTPEIIAGLETVPDEI